ncbi:MAG: endonuclease Q family protein [Desulfobacterales bacterium]|nr:endonuclease Q family protein [Desulfobacterales bacterium]
MLRSKIDTLLLDLYQSKKLCGTSIHVSSPEREIRGTKNVPPSVERVVSKDTSYLKLPLDMTTCMPSQSSMRFIARTSHIPFQIFPCHEQGHVPEAIWKWAQIKGIGVVGTGDFYLHPGWLKELPEKIEPSGNGLFKLKKE